MAEWARGRSWKELTIGAAACTAGGAAAWLAYKLNRAPAYDDPPAGLKPFSPWDCVTHGAPIVGGHHPAYPVPTDRPAGQDICMLGVAAHYSGVLTLAQVREGVDRMLRSHESLRMGVRLGPRAAADAPPAWAGWQVVQGLDNERGYFAQWAQKLVMHEPRRSPEQWKERIACEVNKGFPTTKLEPMWRVICLQDEAARQGDIIVVYCHNVGDGVAAHTLAHGVLAHSAGEPALPWPGRRKIDMSDCLGPPKLWQRVLTSLLLPIIRREFCEHRTVLPPCGAPTRVAEGRPVLPVFIGGAPGKLPQVLRCAKQQGVRFFALCTAANVFALAPAVYSDPKRNKICEKYYFPAGLRGRCTRSGVSMEDVANVALLPDTQLRFDRGTRFWDLARAIQKGTVKATSLGDLLLGGQVFIEMLKYDLGVLGEIFGDCTSSGDFMVSNLGAHPWQAKKGPHGDVHLNALHFHQHFPSVSTRGFMVWPMSVGDSVTYSMTYAPWHVSKAQAEAFAVAFRDILDDPAAIGDMTVGEYAERHSTPLLTRKAKE
eukprot:TRINITY_DN4590_c1_g4_i1.p1 TRINITY_DN4590_c1_g4~~TRINITY_DN4590_c1_g4_i1.p1  ORF type:complete len:573 (+),score=151.86 TRINITY_DN4590_c1_g4_i1:93-1721(+)